MRGNITRRGKSSWRLKFDLGTDSATGKRNTQFVTVRGTKKEAEADLARRLNQVEEGSFVEKSGVTVGQYAQHWLSAIASAKTGAKTRERYGELVNHYIIPQLGAIALQKLEGGRIDEFYAHLRTEGRRRGAGGLSTQTIQHIHRLLTQILSSAVKAKKLRTSPMASVQTRPKVKQEEIQILDDDELGKLLRYLKGRPIYVPVLIAAATGMRRGEVLALRWKDIDFDRATLQVAQVAEQTKTEITVKEPKTARSRRSITLPARLVQELRAHRKAQAALRLRLGLGKDEHDLVFTTVNGQMRSPNLFTREFIREAASAGVAHITFHGLRHTHITHLLRSGVPVHVVSARAGHATPSITLNIYAHLLPGQQEGAAAVVDLALRAALQD